MTRDHFIEDLFNISAEMGMPLGGPAGDGFALFYQELKKWNTRINLVSRKKTDWVRVHFLDSLAPLGLGLIKGHENMIDLGAGAGFPGIPLKIVKPDLQLSLAEGSGKKCAWLRHIVRTLSLENTQVLEGRFDNIAEKLGKHGFNLAVSRAAAKPDQMACQAKDFLAHGGRLLVYTTRNLVAEDMGRVYPYQIPGSKVPSVIWEVAY